MLQGILKYAGSVADHWFFWFGGIVLVVFEIVKRIPTWKEKAEKLPTRIFWGIAGVCLIVAMFQAWREENERADNLSDTNKTLNAQKDALEQKNNDLTNQLIAKERPIILQPTPDKEIERLLRRQDEELARLKTELPSPKKKALQLSNDMLNFSANVIRNQPGPPMISWSPTKSNEEYQAQMNQYTQGYVQWMNGTAADYQKRFAVRVVSLEDDLKSAGLADSIVGCETSNGNTYGVQRCAALIGALADKLPQ